MAALTAKCGVLKLSPWTFLIASDLEPDVGAASMAASSALVRVSSLKLIRHGDVRAAGTR
jgi:hypothetical protein